MDAFWFKNNIRRYKLKCGNFTFHINTHLQNVNVHAFDQIIPNDDLPYYDIVIWIDKDLDGFYIHEFNKAMDYGTIFFPDNIKEFHRILDNNGIVHIDSGSRINKFAYLDETVYACFPYPSDNFYLSYCPNKKEVFIIGNEIVLERILIDFLSVTAKILPLHCGSVAIGDKAFLFLGESKSGKTSTILKLMDVGTKFISDDILFIYENQVVRHGSYINVRNDYLPINLRSFSTDISQKFSHINIFDLKQSLGYQLGQKSEIAGVFMISPMSYSQLYKYQLFPMIPHESIWCSALLGSNYRDIGKFVNESKSFYYDFLRQAHIIKIDFLNYGTYVNYLYSLLKSIIV